MDEIWKKKFKYKKENARKLDTEFLLTIEDYINKAKEANITANQIGCKKGDYQLARYKDLGGYTIDNCRFITVEENQKERNTHFDAKRHMNKICRIKRKYKSPWESHNCTPLSLTMWNSASECYKYWKETNCGRRALSKEFNLEIDCGILVRKFKQGWIPSKDKYWIKQFIGEKKQ